MSLSISEKLSAAVAAIWARAGKDCRPKVGFVLGSGLGAFADSLAPATSIPYADLPHFPVSSTSGHAGRLVVGQSVGVDCAVMQGRAHYYEGYSAAEAVFPVRTLVSLGCKVIVLTNAAGGLRHAAGSLMLIRDHINMIPESPLRGRNEDALGPRFPDMTNTYDAALRDLARAAASEAGVELAEGVYLALAGPAYETPAEIRMYGNWGADAVGMSTAPEAVAARHMGAKVLGISCISNQAAGLSGAELSHAEVEATAAEVRPQFESLLCAILCRLAAKETL